MSDENNNLMAEAIAAVEGQVQKAPEKVPEGKVVVAVELTRDSNRAGKYVEAIDPKWLATGNAIALRDGHVVASNNIFGRFTNGSPKVSACHYVVCGGCGRRVLQPVAVWAAKDAARKRGIEVSDDEHGMSVLKAHGSCACGGKWDLDVDGEKAELAKFADRVLDAISTTAGQIPPFLPPLAFSVCTPGTAIKPIPKGWEWLVPPMQAQGRTVTPFDPKLKAADTIVFNPGFWLGWIDDPHQTGLFWVEDGKSKAQRPRFNPAGIDGL